MPRKARDHQAQPFKDGAAVTAVIRRFETLDRYLREGKGPTPEGVDQVRANLVELATIPSGKRGSKVRRHVLEAQGTDDTPLPAMVHGIESINRVSRLLGWLLRLSSEASEDYAWLLDKWKYGSSAMDGAMRIDGEVEYQRVKRWAEDLKGQTELSFEIVLVSVRVSKARKSRSRAPSAPYTFRIRFIDQASSKRDKNHTQRGLADVRWVLTWLIVDPVKPHNAA